MTKKYKKTNLEVHTYGTGRNKKFIIYTDYEPTDNGPWHTRIYPDIRGNTAKAVLQAIDWLNDESVGEPWIVRNKPSKFFISYSFGR